MSKGVQVDVTRADAAAVATIRGEMDLESAAELEKVLNAVPAAEPLVLDLEAVGFMDSSGLAVVLRQSMQRRDAGASLLIREVSEPVRRLLEFLCLDYLFEGGTATPV